MVPRPRPRLRTADRNGIELSGRRKDGSYFPSRLFSVNYKPMNPGAPASATHRAQEIRLVASREDGGVTEAFNDYFAICLRLIDDLQDRCRMVIVHSSSSQALKGGSPLCREFITFAVDGCNACRGYHDRSPISRAGLLEKSWPCFVRPQCKVRSRM